MKQLHLTITLIIFGIFATLQPLQAEEDYPVSKYAYVQIKGKIDKRMSVEVDLGEGDLADDLEKIIEKELKGYHSYVQILQYFLDKDYELVESYDQVFTSASGGGSAGISFLLKRPIE
ncbi:MAG: hypothetical protein U9R32_06975 [Bacteroidota bacterium]|nr:hypothetical protein [Bacteroidota bacterium]